MAKTVVAVMLGIAVVAVAAYGILTVELNRPLSGEGAVIVDIPRGASLRSVARDLRDKGVISSSLFFEIEARVFGGGGIQAGEYSLPRNISIREVAARLREGKVLLRAVTIPEGFSAAEIAERFEEAGLVRSEDFLAASKDSAILEKWGIKADSAEGYLFPETYHFRKGVPAGEAVDAMLKLFYRRIRDVLPEEIVSDSGKLHELVTLASIIEKETAVREERKLVAAVFKNRLSRGMLLQSDPTVIYALPDFDGNIRKEDLSFDSPYNTYTRKGLPPGPIASPGLASIEAAYDPADAAYLYFVSKNDGSHVFSRTLRDHNIAVRRYQIAKNSSR